MSVECEVVWMCGSQESCKQEAPSGTALVATIITTWLRFRNTVVMVLEKKTRLIRFPVLKSDVVDPSIYPESSLHEY